jgi:hypothetical protein
MSFIDARMIEDIDGKNISDKIGILNKKTSSIVTPSDFGAIGDNLADDTTSLQNAFNASTNKILILEAGKIYKVTNKLTLPKGATIISNGATINFNLSGDVEGVILNDDVTILGKLIVNVISVTPSTGAGQYQCPIVIGDYGSGVGCSNIYIQTINVSTEKTNGNGILITGDSHNIKIENIVVPDSSTIGRALLIHWGGADNPSAGTFHPYNIKIGNVKIGKQTNTSSDGAGVFISGAYNIDIDSIEVEEVYRSALTIFAGDHGFEYAATDVKSMALKNIRIGKVACRLAHTYGMYVDAQAKLATGTPIYDTNILIGSITSIGDYSSNVNAGILLSYCNGVEINNAYIEKHLRGFSAGASVKNVVIKNPHFVRNRLSGTYISNGTTMPENIKIENPVCYSNGEFGASISDRAGIFIGIAKNIKVVNGLFGESGEAFQETGVRTDPMSINIDIIQCHVKAVKSGGVGYSLGSGDSYGSIRKFEGNTVESGITFKGGLTIVPVTIDGGGNRIFTGTTTPTTGTWQKGDRIINSNPSVGQPKGWVCTSGGTPGTWVSEGNL